MTEINGNFNTWDLTDQFQNADAHYQMAVIVAYYAELLRLSPWTAHISIGQILEHAVRVAGLLPADREVSQFATLVSRASQIGALLR